MEIVFYHDQAEDFLAALDTTTIAGLPSSVEYALESKYRAAISQDDFRDLSFYILQNNSPSLFCLCHKIGRGAGYYGSGSRFYVQDENNKKIYARAMDILTETSENIGVDFIEINDNKSTSTLSLLGVECWSRKAAPETVLGARIDLSEDEETLHRNLRHRYKSHINRGKREIDFVHITHKTITEENFGQFQNFHKTIAGKVTRPQKSWDVQYEMIEKNCAEIIMGTMSNHGLVSSALYLDHGPMTFYGVAVYDRDLFDYPLAHANVYDGMLRAKARGKRIFSFGSVRPHRPNEEKVYNIGKFKKGFCNDLFPFIKWTLPIKNKD